MLNRRQKLTCGSALFLLLHGMTATTRGDIPPPPPQIPGTQITLPTAPVMLIAGILITVGVVWAGRIFVRKRSSESAGRGLSAVAVVAAFLTLCATVFAYMQHSDYQDRLSRRRSGGPVLPPPPLREEPPESSGAESPSQSDRDDGEETTL